LRYNYDNDHKRQVQEHFEFYFKEIRSSLDSESPIFIYAHGNCGDRSGGDRVELCQRLCDLGYHVFAIDYRGFGDSTGRPTEAGLVHDVICLYNLIKSFQKNGENIFLWGHSLGTGVSCHVSKLLKEEYENELGGVILEAPFTNMDKAASEYFLISSLLTNNSWIKKKVSKEIEQMNIGFRNDEK
jgi:pimeloyl-ACP methyl ester carboxylesterase